MNTPARIALILGVALAAAGVVLLKHRRMPAAPRPEVEAPRALPRLVDLGAGKCIPCKAMAPILADLSTSLVGRLRVDFIDVWEKPEAAEPYAIDLIPTQIFFDPSGKELFRHEGFFSRADILAKWKELGFDLQPGGGG